MSLLCYCLNSLSIFDFLISQVHIYSYLLSWVFIFHIKVFHIWILKKEPSPIEAILVHNYVHTKQDYKKSGTLAICSTL